MARILFVNGFHSATRACELAFEFERFGQLVRCDIPPSRTNRKPYAFVEFRSSRDAEGAYFAMSGRYFRGFRIQVEWAKNPPSLAWRNRCAAPDALYRSSRDRKRSQSPVRCDASKRDRQRYTEKEGSFRGRRSRLRRSMSPDSRSDDHDCKSPKISLNEERNGEHVDQP
ncbi:hypothetical protein GALMADRAFT_229688 [Galerina marginata CBS 339.88]|uniref:RRM domain-containing protein n=1 Tax=Galerina marginata (strain CBS 339.88) TaxID=685588 RepID=A0A067SJ94_GALM3|nr:hypothetical protein GALMADRAFT_229688 [Galerina marginata CBS 339.88]